MKREPREWHGNVAYHYGHRLGFHGADKALANPTTLKDEQAFNDGYAIGKNKWKVKQLKKLILHSP